MKKQIGWYAAWAGMYILCAGLGFIPNPAGAGKAALVAASVLFFVPPAVLLRRASPRDDRAVFRRVRNIAAGSLGATTAALIANFFTLAAPDAVGTALHIVLGLVSAPMLCAQYWVLSLFLWACLLLTSLMWLRQHRAS